MEKGVFRQRHLRLGSFTLVELLIVIAIIAILAGLTLIAGEAVMAKAAQNRAASEIQGMASGLENYKTDYGAYPAADTFSGPTNYSSTDGSSSGGDYQLSSQILYQDLSGKTNFLDPSVAGVTAYYPFTMKQVGNASAPTGSSGSAATYVQDPFGFSYGYYTGTASAPPNNGFGFFDLWSTGGVLQSSLAGNPNLTNSWISNWQ